MRQPPPTVLWSDIDQLASQLKRASEGHLDISLVCESADERVRALASLIEEAQGTARRALEKLSAENSELRAREAWYRALFESVSDGVAVFETVDGGKDFVFRDVNRASLEIEQVAPEQVIGRRVTEVFPGVGDFGLLEVLRRVLATGHPERFPVRLYRDQRIAGWRENLVCRLSSREVMAVYRDLTSQVSADADLRAQRQFLEVLLASIPSPVFYKDTRGRYLGCNTAFEELVGRKAQDIIGRTVQEAWPERYAATYQDKDLELFNNPGKQQYEFKVTDPSGQQRDVVFYKSTFNGPDGQVAGLVGVMLDITERKQRERMEPELRQAQKLQAVGRLAAGIAHEINTPAQYVGDSLHFVRSALRDLTGLIGRYRSRASREEITRAEEEMGLDYLLENVPKALDEALDGMGRVAAIVRSMKEFAHPDRSEMVSIDINEAIRSTLTIARNEYKYVAELETDLGELPAVRCFPGELNQVVLNIVVNAAHAVGEVVQGSGAKGRIVVRTRRDGEHVVISIADTGPGIPAEIRERIFDPFFTTKEVGKGTGQGLAIASSVVVEKHGGTLTFDTEVGKGTTFHIRLPIEGAGPRAAP